MITREIAVDSSKFLRPNRIGTILTALTPALALPIDKQKSRIDSWSGAAANVIVFGLTPPNQAYDGLRWVKTQVPNPSLRSIFLTYIYDFMSRTQRGDVVAVCPPNIGLSRGADGLFKYLASKQIDRAWCFYDRAPKSPSPVPDLFIMASDLIPHIVRDIRDTTNLADGTWATWLEEWLHLHVGQQRYLSATEYGMIDTPVDVLEPVKAVISPEPPKPTPEPVGISSGPIKAVIEPKIDLPIPVVKRKPGRPRKVK